MNAITIPLAAAGAIVLAAAFLDPAIAAALIAFLAFSRAPAISLHSANVLPAVLAAVLGIAAATRWHREHDIATEGPRRAMSFVLLSLPYAIIVASSYLWAANTSLTRTAAQQLALIIVVCAGFIAVLVDRRALRWAMTAIMAGGVFLALFSLHQVLTGGYGRTYGGFAVAQVENIVGTTDANRIGGPFADPNFFGQLMIVPVALGLQRLSSARYLAGRLAAFATVALCASIVFLTYSRGALVALLVVIAMWIGTLPIARRRGLFIGAAVGVALVASLLGPRAYFERLAQVRDVVPGLSQPTATTRDDALLGRQSALISGWRMFTDNPVAGVGAGNYTVHYLEYAADVGLLRSSEQLAPHSLLTEVAAETGIVGVLTFGGIVLGAFVTLKRSRRAFLVLGYEEDARSISAIRNALTGYLVAGLFLHAAYPHMLWLLLALAWATPQTVPKINLDDDSAADEAFEPLRSTV